MSATKPRTIIIATTPANRRLAIYWNEKRRQRILTMLRQEKTYDEIASKFAGQSREAIRQVIEYYRIGWGEPDIWLKRPNVNLAKHGIKIVQPRRKPRVAPTKKSSRTRTRYR